MASSAGKPLPYKYVASSPQPVSISTHNAGLYQERQVVNYLRETLYVVNSDNKAIPVAPSSQIFEDRYAVITVRTVSGNRKADHRGLDVTSVPHETYTVTLDALRNGPVFIGALDIFLCLHAHIAYTRHPNSQEEKDALEERSAKRAYEAYKESLISICANDPLNRFSHLYVELGGQIFRVPVTAYSTEDETDKLHVYWRPYDKTGVECESVSISDLLANAGRPLWRIGPFMISHVKEVLENYVRLDKKGVHVDSIPVEEHRRMLDHRDRIHKEELESITLEMTTLKRTNKALESAYSTLTNADYSQQNAQIKLDQLSVDRDKIHTAQREAEEKRRAAREERESDARIAATKAKEEAWKTVALICKTAAVLVPTGIAIWKGISAAKGKKG